MGDDGRQSGFPRWPSILHVERLIRGKDKPLSVHGAVVIPRRAKSC